MRRSGPVCWAFRAPDRQKNFFELGGHSLLLATLHQRIQDELNVRVGLVDLFQFPTIQAQAAHLSALRARRAVPALHRLPMTGANVAVRRCCAANGFEQP